MPPCWRGCAIDDLDVLGSIYIYNEHRGYPSIDCFDAGARGGAVCADFAEEAGLKAPSSEKHQGTTERKHYLLVVRQAALDESVRRHWRGPAGSRADGVPLAGIAGLDLFGCRTVDSISGTQAGDPHRPASACCPAQAVPVDSPLDGNRSGPACKTVERLLNRR